ncbi:MAG: gas vesicle protein GvpH [Halobacteria archaeon]
MTDKEKRNNNSVSGWRHFRDLVYGVLDEIERLDTENLDNVKREGALSLRNTEIEYNVSVETGLEGWNEGSESNQQDLGVEPAEYSSKSFEYYYEVYYGDSGGLVVDVEIPEVSTEEIEPRLEGENLEISYRDEWVEEIPVGVSGMELESIDIRNGVIELRLR